MHRPGVASVIEQIDPAEQIRRILRHRYRYAEPLPAVTRGLTQRLRQLDARTAVRLLFPQADLYQIAFRKIRCVYVG